MNAPPLGIATPGDLADLIGLEAPDFQRLRADQHVNYEVHRQLKRDDEGNPVIRNGRRQLRTIHEPSDELKAVQRTLLRRFLDELPTPEYICLARGRSHLIHADRHRGRRFHFKTDVRDFFGSIRAPWVAWGLRSVGVPGPVAAAIRDLTTLHGRVPQGAPTSNAAADYGFRRTDARLAAFAVENSLIYTRFGDDTVLSGSEDFHHLQEPILDLFREGGVLYHHRKTTYKVGPLEVTGLLPRQNDVAVSQPVLARLDDPNRSPASKRGIKEYVASVERMNQSVRSRR